MNPEQPSAPIPGSGNYDFIINPQKPSRRLLGGISNNPLIMKIVFVAVGAVVLIIIIAVVANILFGTKTNISGLVAITQTEQELVRLSGQSKDATAQAIKNAAVNTEVSIKSQQKQWLAFLDKQGRKVETAELAIKKNDETDKKLTTAKQTSTFDETYTLIMRSQLETYAGALESARNAATSAQERKLLETHQQQVDLLLMQWPT